MLRSMCKLSLVAVVFGILAVSATSAEAGPFGRRGNTRSSYVPPPVNQSFGTPSTYYVVPNTSGNGTATYYVIPNTPSIIPTTYYVVPTGSIPSVTSTNPTTSVTPTITRPSYYYTPEQTYYPATPTRLRRSR